MSSPPEPLWEEGINLKESSEKMYVRDEPISEAAAAPPFDAASPLAAASSARRRRRGLSTLDE